MQTGYTGLHRDLKTLPHLMYEDDSDLQDTTGIVWVLFSAKREIKTECLLATDQQVFVIS